MEIRGNVVIGGAGIGGLALAARLAARGAEVLVLDQAPAPAPVGSGFVLQPVGLAALADLGLAERVIALGARIDRLHGETVDGRLVLSAAYAAGGRARFGVSLQRAALFGLLRGAALGAGAVIRQSAKVVAGDASGLTLETGERVEGGLVVDALGATSPLSPDPGAELDYGALWATLQWRPEDGFAANTLEQRYWRASKMAGVLPIGAREDDAMQRVAYFWSLRREAMAAWRNGPLDDWKAEATALWPATAPLLGQIRSHDDLVPAVYRHRTLRSPVTDGLVHIGDSYHAASPQLGQGANMALLDAAALDYAFAAAPHRDEALRDYSARRRWHVRLYQLASRLFTPVYQSDSRILPWIRDRAMAPVSRIWPGDAILSAMIAGTLGAPLAQIGLEPFEGEG